MKILLFLALLSIVNCKDEAGPHDDPQYFNTSFSNQRFEASMYNFLKSWDIPPRTETILGGYLPYCGGPAQCNWINLLGTDKSNGGGIKKIQYFDSTSMGITNVHGVYFDVREHAGDDNIWNDKERVGLAIVIHGSSWYDLYMYMANNVESGSLSVSVKICHWITGSINDTQWYESNRWDLSQGTVPDCKFNHQFALDTKLITSDFYGFQWTDT